MILSKFQALLTVEIAIYVSTNNRCLRFYRLRINPLKDNAVVTTLLTVINLSLLLVLVKE